ncbi:MAG: NADH-quinone oxidoreductase subunit N [Candidatus Dasytiphilus stammeri]
MLKNQVIALLPLLITGVTSIVLMLYIAWKRNHLISMIITIIGLFFASISLYILKYIGFVEISTLLSIDSFYLLFSSLILFSNISICIFAYIWLRKYEYNNQEEFYLLLLIITMGGLLLASTNNLSSLFLGIELISMPLLGLIGYDIHHNKQSLEACVKYTVLSAISSSFFLFGIALIYAQYGQLNFYEIGYYFKIHQDYKLIILGFGLLISSIGFKLSIVPFHLWTPEIYQKTSDPVTALLSTTSKVAIMGAVARLFISISITDNEQIRMVLETMAFLSILVGNIMALHETNIKKLLAYSSIAHFGYFLIALIFLHKNQFSIETINLYSIYYLFSNLGIFGIITLISSSCYSEKNCSYEISYYRGLFWRYPIITLLMTIMILSLAGLPLTIGFIGKLYIIMLSIMLHFWLGTIAIIIGSIISIYYYLRIIINLYLSENLKLHPTSNLVIPINCTYKIVLLLLIIITIIIVIFGIFPQHLIEVTQLITQPLLFFFS